MDPVGEGNFQPVKLQRPGRATVRCYFPRDVAAMAALNPIITIAVPGTSTCAIVNSLNRRTKTNLRRLSPWQPFALWSQDRQARSTQTPKLGFLDACTARKVCLEKVKILFGLSCRNGILHISQAYLDEQKY
jgi:hypothetical protein